MGCRQNDKPSWPLNKSEMKKFRVFVRLLDNGKSEEGALTNISFVPHDRLVIEHVDQGINENAVPIRDTYQIVGIAEITDYVFKCVYILFYKHCMK